MIFGQSQRDPYRDLAERELRKRITEYACKEGGLSANECAQAQVLFEAMSEGEWETFLRTAAVAGGVAACTAIGAGAAAPICGIVSGMIVESILKWGEPGRITGCWFTMRDSTRYPASPWLCKPGQVVTSRWANRYTGDFSPPKQLTTLYYTCDTEIGGETGQEELRTDAQVRNLKRLRWKDFWGGRDWDGSLVYVDRNGNVHRNSRDTVVVDYFQRLFFALTALWNRHKSSEYFRVDQNEILDYYKVRSLVLMGEQGKGDALRGLAAEVRAIDSRGLEGVAGRYQTDPEVTMAVNGYIEDKLPEITREVEIEAKILRQISVITDYTLTTTSGYPAGAVAVYDASIQAFRILVPR